MLYYRNSIQAFDKEERKLDAYNVLVWEIN